MCSITRTTTYNLQPCIRSRMFSESRYWLMQLQWFTTLENSTCEEEFTSNSFAIHNSITEFLSWSSANLGAWIQRGTNITIYRLVSHCVGCLVFGLVFGVCRLESHVVGWQVNQAPLHTTKSCSFFNICLFESCKEQCLFSFFSWTNILALFVFFIESSSTISFQTVGNAFASGSQVRGDA